MDDIGIMKQGWLVGAGHVPAWWQVLAMYLVSTACFQNPNTRAPLAIKVGLQLGLGLELGLELGLSIKAGLSYVLGSAFSRSIASFYALPQAPSPQRFLQPPLFPTVPKPQLLKPCLCQECARLDGHIAEYGLRSLRFRLVVG